MVAAFWVKFEEITTMKLLLPVLSLFLFLQVSAAEKDSVVQYALPDSVNAVSFITDISIQSKGRREVFAGIRAKDISLVAEADKKKMEISFEFPSSALVTATGIGVKKDKGELEWNFDWKLNTTYKLLIATAADSAGNFVLYSGYIFLPEQHKWKLIGTCRMDGRRTGILEPAAIRSVGKNSMVEAAINNTWCQRANGSWKRLDNEGIALIPAINPMPNVDSIRQFQADKNIIDRAIASGKADLPGNTEGVYYKVINPGTGKSFTASDTITVRYSLRIFGTGEVISGGSEKPDTFPLNRLIKAWQIAVPLIKTAGKIRLVIPSGLGYSIRTRAPKIPPNSILDFDIEVLDAKPAVK